VSSDIVVSSVGGFVVHSDLVAVEDVSLRSRSDADMLLYREVHSQSGDIAQGSPFHQAAE